MDKARLSLIYKEKLKILKEQFMKDSKKVSKCMMTFKMLRDRLMTNVQKYTLHQENLMISKRPMKHRELQSILYSKIFTKPKIKERDNNKLAISLRTILDTGVRNVMN